MLLHQRDINSFCGKFFQMQKCALGVLLSFAHESKINLENEEGKNV